MKLNSIDLDLLCQRKFKRPSFEFYLVFDNFNCVTRMKNANAHYFYVQTFLLELFLSRKLFPRCKNFRFEKKGIILFHSFVDFKARFFALNIVILITDLLRYPH